MWPRLHAVREGDTVRIAVCDGRQPRYGWGCGGITSKSEGEVVKVLPEGRLIINFDEQEGFLCLTDEVIVCSRRGAKHERAVYARSGLGEKRPRSPAANFLEAAFECFVNFAKQMLVPPPREDCMQKGLSVCISD